MTTVGPGPVMILSHLPADRDSLNLTDELVVRTRRRDRDRQLDARVDHAAMRAIGVGFLRYIAREATAPQKAHSPVRSGKDRSRSIG